VLKVNCDKPDKKSGEKRMDIPDVKRLFRSDLNPQVAIIQKKSGKGKPCRSNRLEKLFRFAFRIR
jgi:hypothetical protein